jgi:putative ABC transport system ATP-binding protein
VNTVLELSGVSKSYAGPSDDVAVLIDVDLCLAAGDKASLVGPSGSGKSTLLALIAGLLRPDSGVVRVGGESIGELGDRHRSLLRAERIGIALQSDNLIPFLSAVENVELAMGFRQRGARFARRRAGTSDRAMDLLDRFGVADRAQHRPRQLSGGEAQRVALAVSMANDPDLLLADEVVAALDGDTAASVVSEVMDADFAVLFVTHDRTLADAAEQRFELVDHRLVRR